MLMRMGSFSKNEIRINGKGLTPSYNNNWQAFVKLTVCQVLGK